MTKAERRKAEVKLQFTLALADATAVVVSVAAAYALRFHSALTHWVPAVHGVPPWPLYGSAAGVMALVWVALNALLGLYRPRAPLDVVHQFEAGLRSVAAGIPAVLALGFFYRDASFSRLVLVLAAALLVLAIPACRLWLGRAVARRLPEAGVGVLGGGAAGKVVARALAREGLPGVHYAGSFKETNAALAAHAAGQLDRVIVAPALGEQGIAEAWIRALWGAGVEVEWVPAVAGLAPGRLRLDTWMAVPVLTIDEFPLLGWNAVAKRTLDLTLAGCGLVALAPVLGALALAVKCSSPGPILYRQERLGRDGCRFQMLKFRSMREDAEVATGPTRTLRGDPRITEVGRFLRRTSLDELPQLWNVLCGQMSLVGPRPERPALVPELVDEIPDYLRRLRVKSGMTGFAQVQGLRGTDSSMEERILADLYYIENWTVWMDLRILVRTVVGVVRGEPNAF